MEVTATFLQPYDPDTSSAERSTTVVKLHALVDVSPENAVVDKFAKYQKTLTSLNSSFDSIHSQRTMRVSIVRPSVRTASSYVCSCNIIAYLGILSIEDIKMSQKLDFNFIVQVYEFNILTDERWYLHCQFLSSYKRMELAPLSRPSEYVPPLSES